MNISCEKVCSNLLGVIICQFTFVVVDSHLFGAQFEKFDLIEWQLQDMEILVYTWWTVTKAICHMNVISKKAFKSKHLAFCKCAVHMDATGCLSYKIHLKKMQTISGKLIVLWKCFLELVTFARSHSLIHTRTHTKTHSMLN